MNTYPVRVLLIEDDPEKVVLVKKALAKAPEIQLIRTPAGRLSDGLRRLAARNVGVVLLDLNLPDTGGLDALRSIREAFPEIPVLVVGSLPEGTVPLDAIKLGAQDYFATDEFSGPMLARAVRYAMERKQAERALRGGAELFRNVYQEAPIGIVLTSREGKFISANPTFCRMLGYTVEEISGIRFLDVTHPDHRGADSQNVQDMWNGKVPHYRTEKRYVTKNGATRWGGLSTSLIRDGEGRPLYAMAMVEDITERKHAEDLLKQGEERYKLMFDSAPLAINITRGTEITYANPSYLKMFGFSNLDELKSRAPVDLFTPESRPQILENIQRRAEGLPVPDSYEAECLRKDGTRFPVLMHLTRAIFADGPATVAFVMDMTERRRAEYALKQSEEKFRQLSERSQVGIYIMQDARMSYVNPAFAQMFGCSAEEIMSMPSPQDLLRPADVGRVRTKLQQRLRGDADGGVTSFRGTRKDGSIVEIEARGALIDYGGRPAVLGTAIDVTERKRGQELQDAVYRIGNATLTTGSLHDLYAEIHHVISGVMNAENFYIALYDEERDLLTFPYFKDAADGIYVDEVHPEKGLTAYVLRTGESLLCTQAVHDELERRGEVKLLGAPSSIWLGVPLSIQGKTIGAIVVQHYSDPAAYGEREQHMLEFVSAQVAVAIERKRAEEAVRLRADELAALNATVLEITTPHDLNALLQTIVERAAQLLGTRSGGMYLCDPLRREVRCVVSYNTAQDFTGTILKYGEGAAGTVAQTGEPLIINDYRVWGQRAASYEERQPFTAVLSAPMFWNNQVVGVLHVLHDTEGRRFKQSDLALLTQFATHAAIAVENTRLYEEAQREITDRGLVEAHLRNSETALQGILESAADGILAISSEGRVLHANERFVEMWRIPQSIMATQDDPVLLQHVLDQLNDPQAFLDKVQELYKSTEESLDTLTFKDGRVFERRSRPLMQEAELRGRVWSFLDITQRMQAQTLQDAVYRIGSATLTTGSLHDLYAEIHHVISGVMNAENFYIALYDEERDLLTFPYFKDAADGIYVDEVHPEKGLTAYVLRTGESLLCTQAVHDELERRGEVKLLGAPSSIWLGVPLSIQGKTIGAIVVQHYSDPAAYGEREQHMLEFVSAQVAVAIERKRAEEAVRLRADELAALNATVLEITASHDLHGLLQTIVERAAQLLGARSGGLYLCDPGRREVRLVVSHNTPRDYAGTILKYGEGAAGTVAQTGEPLIVDDYRVWSKRAIAYEQEQPFTAVLSAPMIWHDQVTGVIDLMDDVESRRFTESDLALLTQFASHAAIAVENTRLYEEAQHEITDRGLVEAHLRNSETALQGILESVADGILAISSEGRVLHANERFVEMWRIPQSIMDTQDDAVLLQHVLDQLIDPQAFLDKVQELYKSTEESFDALSFKDGRVFERRSRPLMREAEPRGRVWSFHDITPRKQGQTLQEAVYRIAAATETTGSLDDLYQEIHQIISSVMPAENFYITIYDAAQDLLRFPYFRDLHDESFIEGVQPAKGLTAYVLRTGKSLLCTQAVHDELERRGEVNLLGSPSAIWLGVPLIVEGHTIGAMVVQHYSDPQAYGEREQHMLEFVSAQVAVAIERKRVQESLKGSEARFRALFEDSPISLWEQDFSLVKQRLDSLRQDGIANFQEYLEAHPEVVGECAALVRVLDANKATLAIYGAQRKGDLPEGLAAVLEGSALQDFREELVKIAAGEIRFNWEGVNRTLDGRLIDVDLNWSAVPGHEKTLSRVIVAAIDITQRKQAEKLQDAIYRIAQAADQAESLDALYPAIHAIIRETMVADNFYIALYDKENEMLSFPYFVDAMETSAPATKLGKGLTEYVLRTGKSLLCDEALFGELIRAGQVEPVGAPAPIWLGVPLFVDGKALGVIAVQDYQNARAYGRREQDILEFVSSQAAKAIQRKRAEQALSWAEEKYRSIFENATEAITQTTPDGRYIAANPAAARMLGYESPEDLILDVTDLTGRFYVKPGRRQEFIGLTEEHGSITGFESEVYRRDGATRWISENSHAVRGDDGSILYYEGTAQDITERKQAEQALQQRARELQTLYETSLEVSAQTSLDKLLNAIVGRAASLVGTDGGGLYLMEPDGQSLRLLVGHNLPQAYIGTRLRLGEGISGTVAKSGRPTQVEDYQTWPGRAKAYDDAPFRRVLAIPLKVKDKMIGVINVTDSTWPGQFSEDQVRLASLFADQAALAIEAARLYQEEHSRSAELVTLYESATAMSSNLALDVVLKTVVEQVTKALNTDECSVSFVDNARDAVVTMLDYAPTAPEAPNGAGTTYLLRDYPTTRRVLESRQPLQLSRNDPASDTAETTLLEKTGMGTLLLVPLVARGQVSGLMELYWKEKLRVTTKDELHLAQSLSAQIAVYLENSRLFERSERRLARTLALHRIDQAVTGSTDVSLILQVILDQALPQLGAAAAAVLLYDPITQGLNYARGAGFRTDSLRHTHLAMGQGYAGRAAMARQMVHIPDLRTRNTDFLRSPSFSQEGFISYTAVPMIAKGEIKGVLEVFHRTPLEPDAEWQSFLETLAGQAATAVDSATMFEDLQRANDQLTLAYDATIEGWSRAMDLRDRETEGHSQRVAEMTVQLARLLGLPDQNLIHVRRGALLHDIGKMGVPDEILQKVGPLSDEEWVVMKRHPVMAYEMLSHIRYLEPALEIPYCHHEKWDGTGYPRGLQGDRIPQAARVFAVVDVYDALTADRPYRAAWTPEQALEYIRAQSGKHFEPAVAEAFLGMTVLQT